MKNLGVRFIDDAMVELGYRKCIEGARGQVEIVHTLELERVGGPCPICRMLFGPVNVDNEYGKFTYYEPGCRCFPRCPQCKRWLVEETLLGIKGCTSCRPHEYGMHVDAKPKRGRSSRVKEDAA